MTLSARQQRSNRLYLAYQDMAEALRYLYAYQELNDIREAARGDFFYDALSGVMLATIVAYARPFVRSASAGQADPKIEPLALFEGVEDFKTLHEAILLQRHKAAAHADWEHHRTELIDDGSLPGTSLRMVRRPRYGQDLDLEQLAILIQHCQRAFIDESLSLDSVIRAEEGDTLRKFPIRKARRD